MSECEYEKLYSATVYTHREHRGRNKKNYRESPSERKETGEKKRVKERESRTKWKKKKKKIVVKHVIYGNTGTGSVYWNTLIHIGTQTLRIT